ncbi:MAG: hypothetical protein J3K34DRAFT_432068 [Monoraphidium minutum]|nr:MAG: hypothetical protein J3K34DRAFT_432068 [Monoraphidium minutum]
MCEPGPTESDVAFNYGSTTDREAHSLVCGAARPGARARRCFDECVKEPVSPAEVDEWVAFIKSRGVGAVVSLLTADEVGRTYAPPGIEAKMAEAFGEDHYHHFDLNGGASPAEVLAAIEAEVAAGRKTVVHCWGGGGRTGLVQAAWLARKEELSAADAAAAVVEHAKVLGVPRRVDVAALQAFLDKAGAPVGAAV